MEIFFRNSGVVTQGFTPQIVRRGGGVRGKIKGASAASFRRLRQFCIEKNVPGENSWGVCLTIGGLRIVTNEQFKDLHSKIVRWLIYNGVPAIWRIELQQRGQPHFHLILYCSYLTMFKFLMAWLAMVDDLPPVLTAVKQGQMAGLYEFSRGFIPLWYKQVDCQELDGNDFSVFRYLVAHTSKKSQLGWVGRQWGVVNRKLFQNRRVWCENLDDEEYYVLCRWLRRLCRFRGSCNRGRRQWLVNPNTVARMLDYIRQFSIGCPF